MATFSLTLSYLEQFERSDRVPDADAMRAALAGDTGRGTYGRETYQLAATVTENRRHVRVRLELSAAIEDPDADRSASYLDMLRSRLEGAVSYLADDKGGGLHRAPTDARTILWRRVKASNPQATALVPLLASDEGVLTTDYAAYRAVSAAVRERTVYLEDQHAKLAALQVRLEGTTLAVTGATAETAVAAASAYLLATRRQERPWRSLPRRPVWAAASALIALISFGMSWTPLDWATLSTFSALSVLIAVAAIWQAPRLVARRSVTAWGIAPTMTLCAFAFAYGAIALTHAGTIELTHAPLQHLREPLMLSLSLLTTVGVLDFHVAGWVRSLAYLEMLLVAGLAGGAALVAFRWLSRRADAIVNELRIDRGESDLSR